MNHPLNADERAVLTKLLNEHGYRRVMFAMAEHAHLCRDAITGAHGFIRTASRWENTAYAVEQWANDPRLTHCSVPTWDDAAKV